MRPPPEPSAAPAGAAPLPPSAGTVRTVTAGGVPARTPNPPLRDLLLYGGTFAGGIAAIALLVAWLATGTGAIGGGVDAATRTITLALDDEPPQLDSTRATDQVSFFVLGHVMEGLLRYDRHGDIVPGVAERYTLREDGATFHLRADARWSDGVPVTADDFVFAWRTVVDPATASEYAFILYTVRNAEAINRGELPVTALGVRAVDAHTLDVELSGPVPYFAKLMAFPVFFPIREDFHRAQQGRYGADAGNLLYNGPYVLSRWVHAAHVRLERNPLYHDPDLVRIHAIDAPYFTRDPNAVLNLFRDGRIASAGLGSDTLPTALEQRLRIRPEASGSMYFLEFNHRPGRPTHNLHLRRAMQRVFDPGELVNRVIRIPGNLPAVSLFPSTTRGLRGRFLDEYPPPAHRVDVEAARRDLERARRELGVARIPPLTLLTSDTPSANRQAEYLQDLYGRTLGLELRIDAQVFKQRLAKMTGGDFDIVAAGWGPDYDDPLTFADLFASWNLNNRGRYASAALDAAVRTAQRSTDARTRLDAFAEVQRILYDDAAIIVTHEQGKVFVEDPRLRGVVRRPVGHSPDYTYAWIDDAAAAP
jgi:oligopeptide transport system substrate-binding protein